nr:MAG TPA: HNH endonuclease [Caudoviricetes sp.]
MNWTESKFQSFIKSTLRKGTTRWPPKYEVLNAAKRGKMVNDSTGRLAEHYECAHCHGVFPAKEVQVDHIESVIPLTGFISWDDVIKRMFCQADGLQVLCKTCHAIKSKEEGVERRRIKAEKN